MHILHIIQRYWPAHGGAEAYMQELSCRLAGEGHQVTVATTNALDFEYFWDPNRRSIAERNETSNRVRIVRFPVSHLPLSGLSYPALRRLLWLLSICRPIPTTLSSFLARLTPWVPGLWKWLDSTKEQYDLVAGMTVCFESLLDAGLRFAKRRRIPYVIFPLTHLGAGSTPGQDELSRFYTMRHQIALAQSSDGLVAQTNTERDFYVQQGVPQDRILVAGPGINPADLEGGIGERFRAQHGIEGPLVVFLSAMSRDKGTMDLVEATRRLWGENRSLSLVLAGRVLEPFRRYLAETNASEIEQLHVVGPVTDAEKRDLLAAADIVAMPSRTDSFGIVYLEAWFYGKPVIGARAWGIENVIEHGQDGLLVPFNDPPALADAIAYLLDHPVEREAMGDQGKRKVHQMHLWEHKYHLLKDFYHRLTGMQE